MLVSIAMPGSSSAGVAAELVEAIRGDTLAIGIVEQRERSGDRCERAAAIDIGDQQCARIG